MVYNTNFQYNLTVRLNIWYIVCIIKFCILKKVHQGSYFKEETKLKKYLLPILLISIFMLSGCFEDQIVVNTEPLNQIRVTGSAEVTSAPDIASIQVGTQTFNREVEAAVDENNEKTDGLIKAIIQEGVLEKDIQTSNFSIYPQRDYENNKNGEIIGYYVSNNVTVKVRDLDSIGRVLQSAIDAGANNIYGINFTLDDPEQFKSEARIKAIENAHKKAESMAEAAGVKLGNAVSIDEVSSSGGIYYGVDYDKSAAEANVPIQPGELELTVQVQIVYEIEN
ncbi:DUF541 domain-containing protein [Candidatus Poribacteria bacterium]|nr:DUF541 domain-containing protein [Candidatus Poribacteria bacterium]